MSEPSGSCGPTLWGHLSPLLPAFVTNVSTPALSVLLVFIVLSDLVLGILFFGQLKEWSFKDDGGFVRSLFREMWEGSGYSDLVRLLCASGPAPGVACSSS